MKHRFPMRMCVCACVRACVRACARARACVGVWACVCEDRERLVGCPAWREGRTERESERERERERWSGVPHQ